MTNHKDKLTDCYLVPKYSNTPKIMLECMLFRIPLAQLIFICHNFVIELLKWVGKKVKLNFNMSMATAVNTGRHPFAQRCYVQE